MLPRRHFLFQLSSAGVVLTLRPAAAAESLPLLAESDPKAREVAYVADAATVDATRYPKFTRNQNCLSCSVYQGGEHDAAGGCVLFPGKWVSAKGWCTSWTDS